MINIKYEKMYCSICRNSNIENIFSKNVNEITIDGILKVKTNWSICKHCGFVFQNPVPDEKSLNEYYNLQSECIDESDNIRNYYYKMYEYIKNNTNYNSINKILDIGCRRGEMLKLFKNDNKNILGIEPSDCNVEYLKKCYIPVIKGLFNNNIVENKKFDLILLINVLEHIKNPDKMLNEICNKLTNDGYLLINVPTLEACHKTVNINNISDYFTFQHLQYFTPDNLIYLLQKNGFVIVKYDIEGSSINIVCNNINNSSKLEFKSQYKRNKKIVVDYLTERKKKLANLRHILENINSNGLIIYGAGAHTTQLMQIMNFDKFKLVGICDSDKNKYGMNLAGIKVCNIDEIDKSIFNDILISSSAYQEEIYNFLIKKFPEKNIIKLY
ncbi:methyltransferase domain-containing protein [Clostridium botulinum]|uniref:class I SAM-dependent methyltransferase n=1 Tax=Clostridium sp. ZBS18 TaxID=2949967 RepID=UPI001DAA101F|nr:methyltransferase domain-containing protein [Clostridium sp. ZBS18]MBN1054449.1 methyltransferase domain-containing protein [Clostridium botulinum]